MFSFFNSFFYFVISFFEPITLISAIVNLNRVGIRMLQPKDALLLHASISIYIEDQITSPVIRLNCAAHRKRQVAGLVIFIAYFIYEGHQMPSCAE